MLRGVGWRRNVEAIEGVEKKKKRKRLSAVRLALLFFFFFFPLFSSRREEARCSEHEGWSFKTQSTYITTRKRKKEQKNSQRHKGAVKVENQGPPDIPTDFNSPLASRLDSLFSETANRLNRHMRPKCRWGTLADLARWLFISSALGGAGNGTRVGGPWKAGWKSLLAGPA